ncbi:MAG: hypothetical protein AAF490_13805 [Chloroflexota bacterium]
MNRTVLIILFVVALLIVIGIIAITFINGQDQPQQNQDPPGEGTVIAEPIDEIPPTATPALVQVVVSLQTVPRGHRMSEDILTYDLRKESEVAGNVITDMEDAINFFARNDIFQGETLTFDALVDDPTTVGVAEFGPSSLIPQGFIAMGVPIQDEIAAVAFALDEGDFVDILISFDLYRIDEEFQTYLENDAIFFVGSNLEDGSAIGVDDIDEAIANDEIFDGLLTVVEPFGRIEELANGDQALVSPSDPIGRPIHIALVLQNAKIIQVGQYTIPGSLADQLPTPTPDPESLEETPTPGPAQAPTSTPLPPSTLVVALAPQQQLLLKHAVEVGAEIDFALRSSNDNQLLPADNVDLGLLLELFNIEVPPNFNYTLEEPTDEEGIVPGDGNTPDESSDNPEATATSAPPSTGDS